MNRKQTSVLCVWTFILVLVYLAREEVGLGIAGLIILAVITAGIAGGLIYALRNKYDHVGYICRKLAHLASMKMQERYIIHATKDNYLCPGDLLEDGFSVVELLSNRWRRKVSLSRSERRTVTEFTDVLKKEYDFIDLNKVESREEFVNNNEHWANIREAAQKCEAALGFDLDEWEKEQLST